MLGLCRFNHTVLNNFWKRFNFSFFSLSLSLRRRELLHCPLISVLLLFFHAQISISFGSCAFVNFLCDQPTLFHWNYESIVCDCHWWWHVINGENSIKIQIQAIQTKYRTVWPTDVGQFFNFLPTTTTTVTEKLWNVALLMSSLSSFIKQQ